jgi:MoxR-like ATPase
VLRYIWDNLEQREILTSIVNASVEADQEKENQHPRASENTAPNASEIHKELEKMLTDWDNPETSLAERALIKDRLRFLDNRSEWISNPVEQQFLRSPIDALWKKILESQ